MHQTGLSWKAQIEHDFIKDLMIHTDNQIVTWLSKQSMRLMIQRLCIQTPGGGKFLTKFILFCVTLDLSDNLTEMRNVKNSNVSLH